MAQWLECKVTWGSGDGSVVRVPDSSSKFRGFESQQERWANFLPHFLPNFLRADSYFGVRSTCYYSSLIWSPIPIILSKVQVAGYS